MALASELNEERWRVKAHALLMMHEGLRLRAYADTRGIATIGVGHNLEADGIPREKAMQMTLTREGALDLLDKDIAKVIAGLVKYSFWNILNDVRKAVIIDMAFNLGLHSFGNFTHLIEALDTGYWEGAAFAMQQSLWARQVPNRAKLDMHLMLTGYDDK